jgi:uncharacterized protein
VLVGVCRVALSLSGVHSLKEKRSIVRSVLERTLHRHPLAGAEVGDLDRHDRAVLGFAVVSNEEAHATSVLAAVLRTVDGLGLAEVLRHRTQILHTGPFGLADREDDALGSWGDFEADDVEDDDFEDDEEELK